MKTTLPAPLVDLLLDCVSLLIRDNSSGIVVTTLQELAQVFEGEGRLVMLDRERPCRSVARALPTDGAHAMWSPIQHSSADYEITHKQAVGRGLPPERVYLTEARMRDDND